MDDIASELRKIINLSVAETVAARLLQKVITIDITDNHIFINASVKPSDTTNINGHFMIAITYSPVSSLDASTGFD